MNATAKFYTGLALVLVLIVGVSYWAGYRGGYHAAANAVHVTHRPKPVATP